MKTFDWIILASSVVAIVVYGVWKGRGSKNLEGYLMAGRSLPWYAVALSVMATQASAITFLSAPGQTFVDGMRYVQVYLGLPIAMIILSVTALPIYHRLRVFTAYEFLEKRFDLKTRALAAFLFLIQRGLACGLTIFAPALILSAILGWNLTYTNFLVGAVVIVYTALGGSKAVSWTQFYQMLVIAFGMIAAFLTVLWLLPDNVSLLDATRLAGSMGRLNVIDFDFDITNRYNIWSGVIGGCFLALSYFGTDQSQVQRYITARSLGQSRRGLLFNGLMKIPMQFFIFFLGAMVFVFYQFNQPPIFFNQGPVAATLASEGGEELRDLESRYSAAFEAKQGPIEDLLEAMTSGASQAEARDALSRADDEMTQIRSEAVSLLESHDPGMDPSDTNYVFLTFVVERLPTGLVGLLIASILFASMSSTSSELNALTATTVIDIYKRLIRKEASDRHYLVVSKILTVIWGLWAIAFAQYASRLGSLIEAVNILGSIFYGTILGIFLIAFYAKRISGTATFAAAVVAETVIIILFQFADIAWLWWNVIGCGLCVGLAFMIQPFVPGGGEGSEAAAS
jgi:Na+/proline symporter